MTFHTKQKRKAKRRRIKAKPTQKPWVILEMLIGSELRRWKLPENRVHRYLKRYSHRGYLVTPAGEPQIKNGQ